MQRFPSIPGHGPSLGQSQRRRVVFISWLVLAFALGSAPSWAVDESPRRVSSAAAADLPPVALEPDPLFDEFDLEFESHPSNFPDPIESVNRGTLWLNQGLDRLVMDPVTGAYRLILPERVRRSFERFFQNVNSTQTLINDVFQLEWSDAGVTTARLLINSTVGVAGFFDPARAWGIRGHVSDFGQTLAMAGAPSGPYVILPLLGPSNIRDGIGLGVDALFHPTFFLLGGTDVLFFSGSSGLTERARHFDELNALRESSIDYYAALRSAYYQNRQAEIWQRREHRRPEGALAEATTRAW